MYGWSKLNKNESGQAALEAAIILIAFVVVASVFAFAILSAGSASTEKGEQAIYAGLEGVQSSLELKGAVLAYSAASAPYADNDVVFTLALVAGGEPLNVGTTQATSDIVIAYRDTTKQVASVNFNVDFIVDVGTTDALLEAGELAEFVVHLGAAPATVTLDPNDDFTLEIKPPTGGVVQINRSIPASTDTVWELR